MKHLHKIHDRYAVRVVVPIQLRALVGGRELRKWLGADRRIAERNAPAIIADFYTRIDFARATLAASVPTIGVAARAHYAGELAEDDRARRASGLKAHAALNAWSAPHRAMLLRLLGADQLSSDEAEALVGWAADDALANGTAAPSTDRRSLLKALAEVQLEAMSRVQERDEGRISPTQPSSSLLQADCDERDPSVPHPVSTSWPSAAGKPLSVLLQDFHAERTAGGRTMSVKTMSEHKVALRMLEEFLGAGMPGRSISRDDMLAYKRALMQTPANYRQRFSGLTLPEAILANAARKEPYAGLNPQTINNKWLSHVSTIMNWCANNGLLDGNPAKGVKVDEGNGYREPTRAAFSPDDLVRIFGNDLFGDPNTYGSKQWALLIALFTGARSSSEIRRIKLSDIYPEQGVLVFDLTEATKNLHSKRLVPVHRALLDLGLVAYVERLRKVGRTRLFWDWEPEDKINRWFLRTYKAEVGIVDARKVFHSFRNTLKTALARHGVNRDVSDLITGHKDQSVGGIYIGDAALTMIVAMNEGLNRVAFEAVRTAFD